MNVFKVHYQKKFISGGVQAFCGQGLDQSKPNLTEMESEITCVRCIRYLHEVKTARRKFGNQEKTYTKILLTKEVAERLRLSEDYIRDLCRRKVFKCYREGKRGGYRIPEGEVEKYIKRKMKGGA